MTEQRPRGAEALNADRDAEREDRDRAVHDDDELATRIAAALANPEPPSPE